MGLLPLAHRAAYTFQSRVLPEVVTLKSQLRPEPSPDGLPLPPPRLRFLVAGSTDASVFLERGERDARLIRDLLARNGVRTEDLEAVLEFGVGCGRILRHWTTFSNARLHGVDYNAELVEWCRRHLRIGTFATNGPAPPLGYPDAAFDFAYAFSVFTHFPQPLQTRWMAELRRVVTPGGHVLLTTHGEALADVQLESDDLRRFREGQLVVVSHGAPGTNLCNAFHPPDYVINTLARGLEPADSIPAAAAGQDVYLFRREPGSVATA